MGTTVDKITYLNNTKTAIKNAIIQKGGTVSDSDTFRSYADKVSSLPKPPNGIGTDAYTSDNGIIYQWSMVYVINNTAYKIKNNSLLINSSGAIGYALRNFSTSIFGDIKLLSYVEPQQSYAGIFEISGTYATSTYYTAEGCRLDSDVKQGKLFVSLKTQSGRSPFRGFNFSLVNAPSGVSMLSTWHSTTLSSFAGNPNCVFSCVLTGVTKKMNVNVSLNKRSEDRMAIVAELNVYEA